mgnify:CR=1 FL=1
MKCHLSKIMGEKRVKIADMSRETGVNRGTISRLYNETATRVELDVLEQLCIYLDVSIGDLLEVQIQVSQSSTSTSDTE